MACQSTNDKIVAVMVTNGFLPQLQWQLDVSVAVLSKLAQQESKPSGTINIENLSNLGFDVHITTVWW